MRVFVVEPNHRYDLTQAKAYGEIVYLMPVPVHPSNTDWVVIGVREGAKRMAFDPLSDYVCMTGQATNVAIMLSVLHSQYGRTLKCLMFHPLTSTYQERIICLDAEAPIGAQT